jgi:hypothetical protein
MPMQNLLGAVNKNKSYPEADRVAPFAPAGGYAESPAVSNTVAACSRRHLLFGYRG